jgi:hypothetical protein
VNGLLAPSVTLNHLSVPVVDIPLNQTTLLNAISFQNLSLESPLILKGSLNNHDASFFVDNGANTSYMKTEMADCLRLTLTPLNEKIGVKRCVGENW